MRVIQIIFVTYEEYRKFYYSALLFDVKPVFSSKYTKDEDSFMLCDFSFYTVVKQSTQNVLCMMCNAFMQERRSF